MKEILTRITVLFCSRIWIKEEILFVSFAGYTINVNLEKLRLCCTNIYGLRTKKYNGNLQGLDFPVLSQHYFFDQSFKSNNYKVLYFAIANEAYLCSFITNA